MCYATYSFNISSFLGGVEVLLGEHSHLLVSILTQGTLLSEDRDE